MQGFQEQLLENAVRLQDALPLLANAATGEPAQLGHAVQRVANMFGPLSFMAVGLASKVTDQRKQLDVLGQTKTVAESGVQLLQAAQRAAGNARNAAAHAEVNECLASMLEAVRDLTAVATGVSVNSAGAAAVHLTTINTALDHFETAALGREDGAEGELDPLAFVQFQETAVQDVRQLAQVTQAIMTTGVADPSQLSALSQALSSTFASMTGRAHGAQGIMPSGLAARLRGCVKDLGTALGGMIQAGAMLQLNPDDMLARKELAETSRSVVEQTTMVMSTLQEGAKGTQACINASAELENMVVDLETTAMFASAGALADDSLGAFKARRDALLLAGSRLVDNTKMLLTAATMSQDQLADAVRDAMASFTELCQQSKAAASVLGPRDLNAQMLLLNAAKSLGGALGDLLSSARSTAGRGSNAESMAALTASAKEMVTRVSGVISTVKTLEDDSLKGARAVETAVKTIDDELHRQLDPAQAAIELADAEDDGMSAIALQHSTRPLTIAVTKLVASLSSGRTDDLAAAATTVREVCVEMLTHMRACSLQAGQGTSEAKLITDAGTKAANVCVSSKEGTLCCVLSLERFFF